MARQQRAARALLIAAAAALLAAAAPPVAEAALGPRVVCYVVDWAIWRPGACRWTPAQVNPAHCTHVVYSFAYLDESFNPLIEDETARDVLVAETADLKYRENPALKVLLAIGGWSMNEPDSAYRTRWSEAVATPANRSMLINNTMNWLDRNRFDGLDIDWEYPGVEERGGRPTDRAGLALFMMEWKQEAARRGKPYMLTMAAATDEWALVGVDMAVAQRHLDYLSIMTYDYHGSWEDTTNFMSPWVDPLGGTLDIKNTLNHYLNVLGWPPAKLNLGLGLYGPSWTLSTNQTGLGAPTSGPGPAQVCTGQAGYVGWAEVRSLINAGAWVVASTVAKNSFIVSGNMWIGCDVPSTIQMKIDAAKALNLGGLMVWEYSLDDASQTMMRMISAHLPYNPLNYIKPAPRKRQMRPPRGSAKKPGTAVGSSAAVPPLVVPPGQLTVVARPALANPAGLYCGGGSIGNGVCQDSGACCSRWGHCGHGYAYCSLDKAYCIGGPCADLHTTPQAQAPAIQNGTSAVIPAKRGRGWH